MAVLEAATRSAASRRAEPVLLNGAERLRYATEVALPATALQKILLSKVRSCMEPSHLYRYGKSLPDGSGRNSFPQNEVSHVRPGYPP